jgi:hypothetical protein
VKRGNWRGGREWWRRGDRAGAALGARATSVGWFWSARWGEGVGGLGEWGPFKVVTCTAMRWKGGRVILLLAGVGENRFV